MSLSQMWGPNVRPDVVGSDSYTPIKWFRAKPTGPWPEPCGHIIPALVGPPMTAQQIHVDDLLNPAMIMESNIIAVDALPGECPICDDNPRMAIRDSIQEGN